jgi:hypothetical protein
MIGVPAITTTISFVIFVNKLSQKNQASRRDEKKSQAAVTMAVTMAAVTMAAVTMTAVTMAAVTMTAVTMGHGS